MGTCARLLLLATLAFAPTALATEQVPEFLVLDGERLPLHGYPLDAWLKAHPGTLPKAKYDPSNNWRGYIGTWELARGKLWLRKVEVSVGQREGEWDGVDETWPYVYEDVRATLFPAQAEVAASWFSGALIAAKARNTGPWTLLWLCRGELRRRAVLDAQRYREFLAERDRAFRRKAGPTEAERACAMEPQRGAA